MPTEITTEIYMPVSESVVNLETIIYAILYNHSKTIIIRGKAGLYIKI